MCVNGTRGRCLSRLARRSAGWRRRKGLKHTRVANTLSVERPERLEGSRFAAWQLYGLVAGGSRERLEVWQFYGLGYMRRPE
jgi:hypothetical protein